MKYLSALFFLMSLKAMGQCTTCPDITIDHSCGDSVIQLTASEGFDTYTWYPSAGLNNDTIRNPTATIHSPVTYTVFATGYGTNLITNGDFSAGNTGFTSDLIYTTSYSPGDYDVGPNYFTISDPDIVDHTSTSDNYFMSVDGAYLIETLWKTTVTVCPGKNYKFNFYASRADAVQPIFEIHFIGDVTGDSVVSTETGIPYTGTWAWDAYGAPLWNSTSNTTLTIEIINLRLDGFGNDFGLDDMSMRETCFATDTIRIAPIPPPPLVVDTMACLNTIMPSLHATGDGIVWYSPGSTSGDTVAPIPVTTATGDFNYYATQTSYGCTGDSATLKVQIIAPPSFELGGPYYYRLCDDPFITIGPADTVWQYLWMDSVTESPRPVVVGTTNYSLTATNACGSYTDTANVIFEDCDCYIYLPDAFTPNNDGLDDVFLPVSYCTFDVFELRIYDRWGELIFKTNNATEGWNGRRNGQLCSQDVYIVQINYRGAHGINKSVVDKVVLIK